MRVAGHPLHGDGGSQALHLLPIIIALGRRRHRLQQRAVRRLFPQDGGRLSAQRRRQRYNALQAPLLQSDICLSLNMSAVPPDVLLLICDKVLAE